MNLVSIHKFRKPKKTRKKFRSKIYEIKSTISIYIYFFLIFFFGFLRLHPRHMEVSRLGVESQLQLLAYTTATATMDLSHICDLCRSLQQHRILNPLSEARD